MERNDIIKALERCLTLEYGVACKGCPLSYNDERRTDCLETLMKNALALITSQEQKIFDLEQVNVHAHASFVETYNEYAEKCERLTERNEILEAKNKVNDRVGRELTKALEENERLTAENERLRAFKQYFDDLYGTYLYVDGWHENGALEPFDNFYESALQEMEGE